MNDLVEAKVKLYGMLLKLKSLTEAEANIMYELSRDVDIQKLLQVEAERILKAGDQIDN